MIQNNKSKSLVRTILPFLILLFLIPIILINMWNENSNEEKYFNDLDLKLTGIVKYIESPNGYNGFSIVGVDIVSSNKDQVDERVKGNNYYCFINKNKAELYQQIDGDLIGDTIQVDTKTRIFKVFEKGQINTFPIRLYDNKSFFDYAQKKYQKF